MTTSDSVFGTVSVRLAANASEIEEAQRVRYQVFYEEQGAVADVAMQRSRLDIDSFDEFADHLIVVDEKSGVERIVGTYRLLTQEAARVAGRFYSAAEFNLQALLDTSMSLLELGRSCVLPDYRSRPVLQMLWQGIADYITERKIDMMFGCASLQGTDPKALAEPLSYMYHYHMADKVMRPTALAERFVNMNLLDKDAFNAKRVFASLPPIIKGYLRLGGTVGDGAVVDEPFNTVDVLVMVETKSLTARYRNHYERKIQKSMGRSEVVA